jgi:hypothetical protein
LEVSGQLHASATLPLGQYEFIYKYLKKQILHQTDIDKGARITSQQFNEMEFPLSYFFITIFLIKDYTWAPLGLGLWSNGPDTPPPPPNMRLDTHQRFEVIYCIHAHIR